MCWSHRQASYKSSTSESYRSSAAVGTSGPSPERLGTWRRSRFGAIAVGARIYNGAANQGGVVRFDTAYDATFGDGGAITFGHHGGNGPFSTRVVGIVADPGGVARIVSNGGDGTTPGVMIDTFP
jgi:hypothetical protein